MHTLDPQQSSSTLTKTSPRITVSATVRPPEGPPKELTLNYPVALIGSKRHAQIVIREEEVNRSHAAIVNTGEDILVVDLLSKSGIFCNDHAIRMKVMRDGDVLRVGSTTIELHIKPPQHHGPGPRDVLTFEDPLIMPRPLRLVRVDNHQDWDIRESVAIIGSRRGAQVCLEDPQLAGAHSLLFATTEGIGIFDLGSSRPLKVNGKERPMIYLRRQDRLLVGRIGLMVRFPDGEDAGLAGYAGAKSQGISNAEADSGPAAQSLETKFTAFRQEIQQQQENISRREQHVHARELELRRLTTELENQAAEIQEKSQHYENAEYELAQGRAELERARGEVGLKEAELEARCSELTRLADELNARKSEIETFAARYETRRQELSTQQSRIEQQRHDLELENQLLGERRAELDAETRALAERRAEIDSSARTLADRSDRLQIQAHKIELEQQSLFEAKQIHEQRAAKLASREQQLREYEQHLQTHARALEAREQELSQRSDIVQQFNEFLQQANQAYRVPADSSERPESVPAMPAESGGEGDEAPSAELGEATEIIARTHRKMHATVQQLQEETSQMIAMLGDVPVESDEAADPVEEPAEAPPTVDATDQGPNGSAPTDSQERITKRGWWHKLAAER